MREKLELHCDVISGYAFSTSDWREEGIPVVKIGNISNGEDIRRKNENWKLVKLSQFGYSLESGSRPKGGIDSFLQEGYPSLGAEAIGELGKFDFSTAKLIPEDFYKKMKRGLGKDKDILLYKDGAYIGKVTLFRTISLIKTMQLMNTYF